MAERCEKHSNARAWEVISDGLSPGQRRIQELEEALAKAEARIRALMDSRNATPKGRGINCGGKYAVTTRPGLDVQDDRAPAKAGGN